MWTCNAAQGGCCSGGGPRPIRNVAMGSRSAIDLDLSVATEL